MIPRNFYGQSPFPLLEANKRLIGNEIIVSPATAKTTDENTMWRVSDGFCERPTRFQRALHDEVLAFCERSRALDAKTKNAATEELSPDEQNALAKEYSALDHAQKLMELIVAEMQKCAASIVANFR